MKEAAPIIRTNEMVYVGASTSDCGPGDMVQVTVVQELGLVPQKTCSRDVAFSWPFDSNRTKKVVKQQMFQTY